MKKTISALTLLSFFPFLSRAQTYNSESGGQIYMVVIVSIVVAFGLFILMRQVMLWYFKIDKMEANQLKTNLLLEKILTEYQHKNNPVLTEPITENRLTDEQTQVYFYESNTSREQWTVFYKGKEVGIARTSFNPGESLKMNLLTGVKVPSVRNTFELKNGSGSKKIEIECEPNKTLFIDVLK